MPLTDKVDLAVDIRTMTIKKFLLCRQGGWVLTRIINFVDVNQNRKNIFHIYTELN